MVQCFFFFLFYTSPGTGIPAEILPDGDPKAEPFLLDPGTPIPPTGLAPVEFDDAVLKGCWLDI